MKKITENMFFDIIRSYEFLFLIIPGETEIRRSFYIGSTYKISLDFEYNL